MRVLSLAGAGMGTPSPPWAGMGTLNLPREGVGMAVLSLTGAGMGVGGTEPGRAGTVLGHFYSLGAGHGEGAVLVAPGVTDTFAPGVGGTWEQTSAPRYRQHQGGGDPRCPLMALLSPSLPAPAGTARPRPRAGGHRLLPGDEQRRAWLRPLTSPRATAGQEHVAP